MKLEARNKRLVLERVKSEEEQTESAFVLPDKLKKLRADNEVFRVLDYSDDCTVSVHVGAMVLIEGNMVEESRVGDTTFLTCKENFVIGLLKD
jgi:co-chaperonin GroES (HSP10)